ncbi:DNA alkylation response protein [Rhodococcus sp. 1163]|uniref:acyl-CoA dehydrogenase family protein n=1 Tax=Rhodococcus sp. 1163 TaxID=1905289 RepID=UPI0009FF2679|nr:acyl-CoA dehydrogenase family protein [Rhodococcus sp. 1163]ORI13783.1 DNA alkylation response protein [Rhodococcus sp. 1163]
MTAEFPVTHTVFNQVPDLVPYDTSDDATLLEGLHREGAEWASSELRELGDLAGSVEVQEWGRLANENPPILRTHDRYGSRIDEVEFHPHWHDLMSVAVANGLHATPWRCDRSGAHVARAAKFYAWGQAEAGHMCPISMTYAAVPALRHNAALADVYEPLLASTHYDFGLRVPTTKRGLIAGMSMTEKQGGSDVRANTTTATPSSDGTFAIVGHKWFTSAPMSDMFLTLAHAPGGLSCFLLPRVLPDGTRNRMVLQRLKDKLGNKSNASGELEYQGATGWLVGEEGRGVQTIIEMVNMTRLDCVIGSASGIRNATVRAVHHARHRSAFGVPLIDQPLMRNVLSDLVIESEAATVAMMRLAGATDRAAHGDAGEAELRRIALAVSKYWVCKRAPSHAAEALECLGGNGYVEESGMPRLFRESPLMSIWEGSGNVAALDSLRALAKQPDSVEAYFTEVSLASGSDSRLDDAIARVGKELSDRSDIEYRARRVVELMALVFQGSLLVRHGDPAVADAFCASRLGEDWGGAFGTLPTGVDTRAVLARV